VDNLIGLILVDLSHIKRQARLGTGVDGRGRRKDGDQCGQKYRQMRCDREQHDYGSHAAGDGELYYVPVMSPEVAAALIAGASASP
jgi:hypothetical protein